MDFTAPAFWTALGMIVWTNVVLSGDNAVVIALAARALPPQQQKKAIFWGGVAAILMRVALTLIAVQMLKWPYLKLLGGLLLLYIGVALMLEEEDTGDGAGAHTHGTLAAIRTILVADLVMSLDNVLAVAAAAQGNVVLLVAGLGLSIPLIVFGSTMLLKVMERLPILITAGAALLGYLAGEMMAGDAGLVRWIGPVPEPAQTIAGAVGAAVVVLTGLALRRRARYKARS